MSWNSKVGVLEIFFFLVQVLLTREEKYCVWCKLLISLDPVTELAELFWVHWCTLIYPQVLRLGLFSVMQLHQKLIWYVHFLTPCNHVCEWCVSWKVFENDIL